MALYLVHRPPDDKLSHGRSRPTDEIIEMNLLRIEVKQSRAIREEAQTREESFSASVKQLTEGRDQWRREAERLRDLIEQGPPWLRFWRRLVDSFAAPRRLASEWNRA